MNKLLFLAVLLASATILGVSAQDSCAPLTVNGQNFGLNIFENRGPWSVIDSSQTWTFQFKLCQPMSNPCPSTTTASSKCGTPNSATVCQTWNDAKHGPQSACCSQYQPNPTAALYSNGADVGVTVTYIGGDDCDVCRPTARLSKITVICDRTQTGEPASLQVQPARVPDPTYSISFRHLAGCAGAIAPGTQPPPPSAPGGGISGGSVLLIIIFVGGAVYFVGGVIFMKVARNAEGVEMIPNSTFWLDLPALVKEGVMFIVNKIRGGGSGGYQQVA